MIKFEKGQKLIDYEDLLVMVDGEYDDEDLVPFCHVSDDTKEVITFQANFADSRRA